MTKRAVFLDRDGVINHPVVVEGRPYPPRSVSEFRLMPGVREGCRALKEAGFLLIVATNQPDVGRGTLLRSTVEEIHQEMRNQLPIDSVSVSYESGAEIPPSNFRKPRPGMLIAAAREYGIDLAGSYMIGDRWRDIDCGRTARCKTIFIDHGYVEKLRMPPDFKVFSFSEAVKCIVT